MVEDSGRRVCRSPRWLRGHAEEFWSGARGGRGLRSEGVEAWLLQVGGTLTPEHVADAHARNLTETLTTLGSTNEADLRAAYRASDVLLFPSLYEGFGFPVLEAMASELPVVTSGAGGSTYSFFSLQPLKTPEMRIVNMRMVVRFNCRQKLEGGIFTPLCKEKNY